MYILHGYTQVYITVSWYG